MPSTPTKKKRNRGRRNNKKRKHQSRYSPETWKKSHTTNSIPVEPGATDELSKSIPKYEDRSQSGANGLEQLLQQTKQRLLDGTRPEINSVPKFPMSLTAFATSEYGAGYFGDSSSLPCAGHNPESIILNSISYPPELLPSPELLDVLTNDKVQIKQSPLHKELCDILSGSALLENEESKHYVRFLPDGSWDLVVFRDIHPLYDTITQWPKLLDYHRDNSKGHAKGCSSSELPTVEGMNWALKNYNVLEGFGVKNAQKIVAVHPNKIGSANQPRMYYNNKHGELKSFTFTQWIDYHQMTPTQALKQFCDNSILQTARVFWLSLCPASFVDFGIKREHFDDLMSAAYSPKQFHFGTNYQDNKMSKPPLLHQDSTSCYLTVVQGSSVCKIIDGVWEKACNGGQLVLANGYHHVDYGPQDIAFVKASSVHGVATLSSFTGDNESLTRYSHTMTCKYLRGPRTLRKLNNLR